MNEAQLEAVALALATEEVALIHGPPGTRVCICIYMYMYVFVCIYAYKRMIHVYNSVWGPVIIHT